MTKPWLKGFSIVNWPGGFNGSFDVWEKREEELKMPLRIWMCEKDIATGNVARKEKTHLSPQG